MVVIPEASPTRSLPMTSNSIDDKSRQNWNDTEPNKKRIAQTRNDPRLVFSYSLTILRDHKKVSSHRPTRLAIKDPPKDPIAPPIKKIETIDDQINSMEDSLRTSPFFSKSVSFIHSLMYCAGALITPMLYPATTALPIVVAIPVRSSVLFHLLFY